MEISLKRQVNESILLMNENDYCLEHKVYSKIDRIQAFGGDNFKEVCDKLNVSGKKAYTVCGSGDHPLELATRGFSYIEAFDINILAEHILNLKIAAILSLEYDEYMLFAKNLFKEKELFSKVKKGLNMNTLAYFDGLFKIKNQEYVYHNLFTHKYSGFDEIIDACKNNFSIYNEKEFYYLKKKILGIKIKFRNQNLFELPILEDQYDFIYFSNILLFNSIEIKDFKEKILPEYINHLSPNGILVMHYLHHFLGNYYRNDDISKNVQYLNEIARDELKNIVTQEIEISSSRFGRGIKENDMVLVFKKQYN